MVRTSRLEWRHGWPAVLAATLGAAGSQMHYATLGVFIKPVAAGTGWTASAITAGLAIVATVAVPGAPLAGWLAERFGLNRVVLLGVPLYCLAFASFGLLSRSHAEWIFAWSLLAVLSILVKSNLFIFWITQKFDAARGFALSFLACGAGLLALVMPISTQLLIEHFGWRMAYLLLGAITLAVVMPVLLWGLRACPPHSIHRTPSPAQSLVPQSGLTVREALRRRAFWQIGLIAFFVGCGLIALQVHLVPIYESKGMTAHTAAGIAGIFGAASLFGRFVGGLLLDRFPARLIGMANLLLPAIACLIYLALPLTPITGIVIAALFGLGAGVEGDVLGYIISRYFGVRNFGTIFGFTTSAFAFGGGIGPLLMSTLLDRLGSYQLVMVILFFVLLLCGLLFLTLGDYPKAFEPDDRRPEDSTAFAD